MLQTYKRKIITPQGGPIFRIFKEKYADDHRSGVTWPGIERTLENTTWGERQSLITGLRHALERRLDYEAVYAAYSLLMAPDEDRKAAKPLFDNVYAYATRATGNLRKRALEGHELYRFPNEALELAWELATCDPQTFKDVLPTPRFFARKEQMVLAQAFAWIAEDAANEQTRNLMRAIGSNGFRGVDYILMREDAERTIALFRTGAIPEEILARVLAFDLAGQKRIVDAIKEGGHVRMGYSEVVFGYKQTGVISSQEYMELAKI